MKKTRIPFLFALLTCAISLTGCFLVNKIKEAVKIEIPSVELISYLKINLNGNNEKTLHPILSNGKTDAVYSYSSSNTNIATVSSSGVVKGLNVGTATINVNVDGFTDISASVTVEVIREEIKNYDYTIMYYMSGSDLEFKSDKTKRSEQGFLSDDIMEILNVDNLPDNVKILIQTGGTKKWWLDSSYLEGSTSKISADKLQRWEVVNKKLQLVETLETNYMAKQSSFEEFLNWGLDEYYATQMGVVLSGHGSGVAGCAFDDNYTYKWSSKTYDRCLRTYEVARASENALSNSPKEKFTWIGYDCCLMQCADIASINAHSFEYMVASQELESANGWDHAYYLSYLKDNANISPTDLLPKICDGFILDTHSESEKPTDACLQTLSVLDLSKMSPLVTAFNSFATQIGNGMITYNKVKQAFIRSEHEFGDAVYGLCDFTSFMNELKVSYPAIDVEPVKYAISDLVFYQSHCSKYSFSPCGVNAFFPECMDKDYILQVGKEDYSNSLSTEFKPWQTLCVNFGNFGWESI